MLFSEWTGSQVSSEILTLPCSHGLTRFPAGCSLVRKMIKPSQRVKDSSNKLPGSLSHPLQYVRKEWAGNVLHTSSYWFHWGTSLCARAPILTRTPPLPFRMSPAPTFQWGLTAGLHLIFLSPMEKDIEHRWAFSWFNMKVVANFSRVYVSLYHSFDSSLSNFKSMLCQEMARDISFFISAMFCFFLTNEKKEAKWPGRHTHTELWWLWTHHGRQGGVQAGFRLTVISIAVLITATVIDETYLQVHPTL